MVVKTPRHAADQSSETFSMRICLLKKVSTYLSPNCNSGAPGVDRSNSGFIAVVVHCKHLLLIPDQDNLEIGAAHEMVTYRKPTRIKGSNTVCLEA